MNQPGHEEIMERAIDREVQSRLARDHAYRNAENAEEQAERESVIEDQVVAEFEDDRRYRSEMQAHYEEMNR